MTEAAESAVKEVSLKVVTGSAALGSVLRGVALKFVTGNPVPESIVRGVVLMVMTQDAAPDIIRRGAVLQELQRVCKGAGPRGHQQPTSRGGKRVQRAKAAATRHARAPADKGL